MNLLARVWVPTEHILAAQMELLEEIKAIFDESKITIPYPRGYLWFRGVLTGARERSVGSYACTGKYHHVQGVIEKRSRNRVT